MTPRSTTLAGPGHEVHSYEALLAAAAGSFSWPELDERSAAAMCYTSGTTGLPKGVVYSHRSTYLHSMAACTANGLGISERDRVMPVVPQFHANAWGLAYAALMSGADLVMPDRFMTPAAIAKLIETERVTVGAGVPTIWQGMLAHLRTVGGDLTSLRTLVCGGSALPEAVMRAYADEFGITMTHAWGMTELSPLGSIAREPTGVTGEAVWPYRASQGRLICGVEGRLSGDGDDILPSDGKAVGELETRGPWITASYYKDPAPEKFHDGWLRTGDVGTLDEQGFLRLTDRAKDVIKSGGEWISSMELENVLMAHPSVAEAAVVGVPDERWGERPLAAVVLRADAPPTTPDELRAFLGERIPRWQLPERWCFIAEVPKTSVGKFKKTTLRDQYAAGTLEVTRLAPLQHLHGHRLGTGSAPGRRSLCRAPPVPVRCSTPRHLGLRSAWTRVEDSPSPVYGAALLMRFGSDPIRGSNPRSSAPHQALRQNGEVPDCCSAVILAPRLHNGCTCGFSRGGGDDPVDGRAADPREHVDAALAHSGIDGSAHPVIRSRVTSYH